MRGSSITIPEACRRLRITYGRAYNAVVAGEVGSERDGTRYLINEADLPALAAAVGAPRPAEPFEPEPKRRRRAA